MQKDRHTADRHRHGNKHTKTEIEEKRGREVVMRHNNT